MQTDIKFIQWLINRSSGFDKILAIAAALIGLNYIIPDPLPIIDEILQTPIGMIIVFLIKQRFDQYKNELVKEKDNNRLRN